MSGHPADFDPVLGELTVRRSTPEDRAALARLAQLDSAQAPEGEHVLVEEDGELRAAVSLADGVTIADPFHRTAETLEILRIYAARVSSVARAGERRRGFAGRFHGGARTPATSPARPLSPAAAR